VQTLCAPCGPSSIKRYVILLQACSAGPRSPYWAWGQPCYTQALHNLLQQGQLLASLPTTTLQNMAVTYWVKSGSLETMVWVGQLLTWIQQHTSGASAGAAAGQGAAGGSAGPMPVQGSHPGDVLSIQVHPLLQPYLDLAPATGPQAALQRFLQLQVGVVANGAYTACTQPVVVVDASSYLPADHGVAHPHPSREHTAMQFLHIDLCMV
jgi:hypothetical protein